MVLVTRDQNKGMLIAVGEKSHPAISPRSLMVSGKARCRSDPRESSAFSYLLRILQLRYCPGYGGCIVEVCKVGVAGQSVAFASLD
jgi:hypothetical protein